MDEWGYNYLTVVENIVEKKKEIVRYEQFLFFPTMFSKAFCCCCVKMSIYGIKG